MVIDNCQFTFNQLASDIMPNHMERMRKAMLNPHPMVLFGTQGLGPKGILNHLGLAKDFTGCYVFLEKGVPIYVGTSRSVIQRDRLLSCRINLKRLAGYSHVKIFWWQASPAR